ncbi:alpha/beta hydrolase [Streptomyces sp. NPDC057271]|uniref:alpha/beta hydrolase n=1 Tax=Streptomyces sp. NPDC057271 TaxID=3346078 RepID=UPI003628807B
MAALPRRPGRHTVRRPGTRHRSVRPAAGLCHHRGVDPVRDEAIEYGLRLLQAGVSVELHHYPGTFHGSQTILSAEVSQRQIAELAAVLRRAPAA